MSKINKIAKMVVRKITIPLLSIPLLSIGMLVATPTSSQAINLRLCTVKITLTNGKWKFTLDPENIQSFNYNASFNPEEFAFEEISYEGTYTQTTSPDFSQLNSGLIQGIAGSTSTPVAGDADLFSLIFTPLVAAPQSPVNFFAGPGGFLVITDPDTGDTTTLDPSECPSCSQSVPEPLTILGAATAIGYGAILKRKSSKKTVS
jgi:hypothetical protein